MIIVTGGAGFIGSNVIRALNNRGINDIIVVDDLTDGRKCANLADKKFADYYDFADLIKQPLSNATVSILRAVIHLGAISDTTNWNGRALMRVNYEASKIALGMAMAANCPFIYASSASVYGNSAHGFREQPENERPLTPYAFSKWSFDNLVRFSLAAKKATNRIVGLRYFNVYGPGEAHKDNMASVIYQWLNAIQQGKTAISVFAGSQDIYRDFIYVEDVAEITVRFLETTHEGIYNVGTGVATSFLDVAEAVAHDRANIEMIPFPEALRATYQRYTCADTSKLRANLGIPPNWFTPIEKGIERYRKECFS